MLYYKSQIIRKNLILYQSVSILKRLRCVEEDKFNKANYRKMFHFPVKYDKIHNIREGEFNGEEFRKNCQWIFKI